MAGVPSELSSLDVPGGSQFVASPGVEPGLWVPETRVISIILRGYVWGLKIRCIFVEKKRNANSTN